MADALLLDEAVYDRLAEVKKPTFIFDWLRMLDASLPNASKQVVRECQEDLVQQLLTQLARAPGPPTQKLIGRCLAKLFLVGDTLLLYTAINTCNSMLKSRDDGISTINGRLAAMNCLGTIYTYLGRMIGRSFEDSVAVMIKLVKQSESPARCEIMHTLHSLLVGVGAAASVCYKDIYKAAKMCMTDRVLSVRAAAAKCLDALVEDYGPMHTTELEPTVSLCLRCMDGSNYAVRLEAAKLLGHVLARSQKNSQSASSTISNLSGSGNGPSLVANASSKPRVITLQDALSLLASGFIRGPGGFLKGTSAGDMIKGNNSVNREVRIGVTYSYIEFITSMGPQWLELNLSTIIVHCTNLLANARATSTHAEAVYARHCVCYILGTVYRSLLSEPVQLAAARELTALLRQRLRSLSASAQPSEDGGGENSTKADSGADVDSRNSGLEFVDTDEPSSEPSAAASDPEPTKSNDSEQTVGGRLNFRRGSNRAQRQRQQQHVIICVLDQLTQLLRWLDSTSAPLLDPPVQLPDLLFTALAHSAAPVRLAAANCLRQLTMVLPTQRTILLDRCISCLQQAQRSHSEAILGYSDAIAGILAGASLSTLGIPASRAKQVFTLADELLRAANQNSRLTLPRTQAGWTLLAACMTLGPDLVKSNLPRMLLFWRNAFPRSIRELEAEKQRGDAFTWQVMLEARAGALCSMQSFLEYCSPALITEESIRRLLPPIECALNMLAHLLDIVRIYGNHLKATSSLIRHRLYQILLLLPHSAYTIFFHRIRQSGLLQQQGSYSILLRELVAEFTLTDNVANTTTSLLRCLCRSEDSVTLGSWIPDTDHKILEEQLQPTGGCSPGALEHDPAYLFLRCGLAGSTVVDYCGVDNNSAEADTLSPSSSASFYESSAFPFRSSGITGGNNPCSTSNFCGLQIGGPPPVSVAVIDSSVELFGRIFPCVPVRHRVQMMEHFAECIRLTKSTRQEAVQINVFAALLCAMRRLAETKSTFGDEPELRKSTANLIFAAFTSSSVLLRCTAGECLGRLAQVVGESGFLAELAQQIFDRLRSVRNPIARAGHCLAVGCLHRYVGGLASGQHLSTSVGVLLAIAQDSSVPEVQVWALHALALVADSGGPMFREYVEPSLNLVLQLLLRSPSTMNEIQRSLGRLLCALITTLGPELQGTGPPVAAVRHSCLVCCLIMQDSSDALLQAEAVSCLQRLHMFAPEHARLTGLMAELQVYMSSPHLLLRRAALAYLRQLSQKDADDLYELSDLADESISQMNSLLSSPTKERKEELKQISLDVQLFSRLDVETDPQTKRDIEETILSMLQTSARLRLSRWLGTLKDVLQVTSTEKSSKTINNNRGESASVLENKISPNTKKDEIVPTSFSDAKEDETRAKDDADEEDASVDVALGGHDSGIDNSSKAFKVTPRWYTRVFAVGCVRILISACVRLAHAAAIVPHSTLVPINRSLSADSIHSDLPNGLVDPNAVAHFNLELARRLRQAAGAASSSGDWLILHLSDLIKIAFMSATSESDHLRISGLKLMRDVIQQFAAVPDPDCADHIILEQYQAQVSAALRPAFTISVIPSDKPDGFNVSPTSKLTQALHPSPNLTAAACQVASTWIGSGVARDPQDLQRVHDLLRQAFDNLKLGSISMPSAIASSSPARRTSNLSSPDGQIFCEDAITMEKLAVLRAWADVYIVAMHHAYYVDQMRQIISRSSSDTLRDGQEDQESGDDESKKMSEEWLSDGCTLEAVNFAPDVDEPYHLTRNGDNCKYHRRTYELLSNLVRPVLPALAKAWPLALQDYALLNLPEELANQRPSSGGAFFASDANINRVRMYYAQHWHTLVYAVSIWLQNEAFRSAQSADPAHALLHEKYFNLVLGMCVEALCDGNSKQSVPVLNICLRSLCRLLCRPIPRGLLMKPATDTPLELLHVLYRLILTRESIECHLLCLKTLSYILSAAEERLVKQREVWLSKDSPGEQPRVMLTTETAGPVNKLSEVNMNSSLMLQTTSLIDAEMYELGEGGTLAAYPSKTEEQTNGSGPGMADSALSLGLQPGKSIVFACLEIITCVLARYRPEIVNAMRVTEYTSNGSQLNGQISSDRGNAIPETRFANSSDAPCVLAMAVDCLRLIPDLCAPRVLLSSLQLASLSRSERSSSNGATIFPPDTSTNGTPTRTIQNQGDNLLRILLDLAVHIAQAVLLHPAELSATYLQTDVYTSHQAEPNDLPDIQSWMLSQSGADVGEGEAVISSTTSSSRFTSAARRQRREQGDQRECIDRLVHWTWQQSQLADSIVKLVAKLASHHYPTLIVSHSPVRKRNAVATKSASSSEPDSSSSGKPFNGPSVETDDDKNVSECVEKTTNNNGPLAVRQPTVASDWYELITASLLTLLQHKHAQEESVDSASLSNCCLVSLILVSRIAAGCPIHVFRSAEFRNALVSLLCSTWHLAGARSEVIDPTTLSSGNADKTNFNTVDLNNPRTRLRTALNGLEHRRVCLAAIGLLVGHREPVVSAFFIRTLTPQIFMWLHDLSFANRIQSPISDGDHGKISKCQLKSCLHEAIDVLESLVDISKSSNRQGLLVILLPLLCSILCSNPPSDSTVSQWHNSTSGYLNLDSPEISSGLHLVALHHIISIAPRFPAEFRSVFSALGELKPRLEKAIKCPVPGSSSRTFSSARSGKSGVPVENRPFIQLKTDFSGFGQ
ncbi:unnamed protein product [Calicophoron daubneyi]|uniref:HEAT repeat-containing protein 5B n=1 Tax=Calicophoron daubneyi TaxID=300641 RepID=A0AAV2U0V0_CALDB